MVPVVVTVVVLAVLFAWTRFLYRQSVDRPLWRAFSATPAALILGIAGLSGYSLDRHDRFMSHTSWVGHVIWPQVWIGLVAGAIAGYFVRRAASVGRQG